MALKIDVLGVEWKYPDVYVIGREQIRQFAQAVKSAHPASMDDDAAKDLGHDRLVAPLTFLSILAVMLQRHFFQHNDVGMETMQIVQVDQKFKYYRPVYEGDRVFASIVVDSVDERFGADIVTTRNILKNEAGEVMMESFTTLMGHEGDNSISAKWDPQTGQVVRTAVTA